MYYLSTKKQIHVLKLLVEGNSISSIARYADVHRDTITRLMLRFGEACQRFLDRELRDLEFNHLEIDEIWTFCRKKEDHITGEEPDSARSATISFSLPWTKIPALFRPSVWIAAPTRQPKPS